MIFMFFTPQVYEAYVTSCHTSPYAIWCIQHCYSVACTSLQRQYRLTYAVLCEAEVNI